MPRCSQCAYLFHGSGTVCGVCARQHAMPVEGPAPTIARQVFAEPVIPPPQLTPGRGRGRPAVWDIETIFAAVEVWCAVQHRTPQERDFVRDTLLPSPKALHRLGYSVRDIQQRCPYGLPERTAPVRQPQPPKPPAPPKPAKERVLLPPLAAYVGSLSPSNQIAHCNRWHDVTTLPWRCSCGGLTLALEEEPQAQEVARVGRRAPGGGR